MSTKSTSKLAMDVYMTVHSFPAIVDGDIMRDLISRGIRAARAEVHFGVSRPDGTIVPQDAEWSTDTFDAEQAPAEFIWIESSWKQFVDFSVPEVLEGVIRVNANDVFINAAGDKLVDTGETLILVRADGSTAETPTDWETGFEA